MAKKPTILLIGDVPHWAFHAIIQFVETHLGHKYNLYHDFTLYNKRILPSSEVTPQSSVFVPSPTNTKKNLILAFFSKIYHALFYRLFYFLHYYGLITDSTRWVREILYGKIHERSNHVRHILPPYKSYDIVVFLDYYMGIDGNFDAIKRKHTIKGIFTAGFPPMGMTYDPINKIDITSLTVPAFCTQYLSNCDALLVGAPCIGEIYKPYVPSVFFANIMYETTVFSEDNRTVDYMDMSSPFIVGWTGNPNRTFKGLYECIAPAVELVKQTGRNVALKTRFSGPMETLPDFYKDVHIVAIASTADAGPSLFCEAGLSGIPSISTKIGYPEVIIEDGVNGLFCERDIQLFADKIAYLYDNRALTLGMSKRIRKDILAVMSPEKMAEKWDDLFSYVLRK